MASAFQNGVMHVCFAALAVLAGVCALVGFRHVGRWLRARLCPVSLVALASAAVIATCEAQKRGNGATRAPLPRSEFTVGSAPPPGAVTNAKWRAHGACEDAFYIRATNWWARMPDGGWIDRLRILSSGGFRARGGGAWTNYPPPFAQKLSLAPEANWPLLEGRDSLFWHAVTPSNTLVMTWRGGLFGRSHTNLVDFQAELFNDGSFDYRYADRTEHFAASLPFDIDGDGLENTIDPDPLTAGPDAHGTNAEWYNTVCSNVFAELSWRGGVNSNAYYFVDVVAKRSTRTTLSVSAYGGNAGGTLHVAAQNIGKLVRTGGNTIPFPYRAVVPPYSSVSLSVEYEAAEHSESTDDISVAASVISLDGSSSEMSSDTVTAIQLRITSCRDFPVFVNRHVYGICEDIWCEWFPQSASIN